MVFKKKDEMFKMGRCTLTLFLIITKISKSFPRIISYTTYNNLLNREIENRWLREKLDNEIKNNAIYRNYLEREKQRKINKERKKNGENIDLLMDYKPLRINEKKNDSGV